MKKQGLPLVLATIISFSSIAKNEIKQFDKVDFTLSIAEQVIENTPLHSLLQTNSQVLLNNDTKKTLFENPFLSLELNPSFQLNKIKRKELTSTLRDYTIPLFENYGFLFDLNYQRLKTFDMSKGIFNQKSKYETLRVHSQYVIDEEQQLSFDFGFERIQVQNNFGLNYKPNQFKVGFSYEGKF